jgi:hypothetical protein
MDYDVPNKKISRPSARRVGGRKAIVLEFSLAKGAIELRTDQMLKHGTRVVHSRRSLLAVYCLCNYITNDGAQAPGSIEPDLEWLAGEELVNALNPKRLNRIKVDLAFQSVQERDILAHIVQAAARGAPAFGSQHARNAVPFEDSLHGSFAKAENLPATFGEQFFRIDGKPQLPGVFRHYQRNR